MRALFIVAVVTVAGAIQPAPPRVPHEEWKACPFELCTYGQWRATARVPVLRDRRVNAPVAFTVKSGELVDAVTGVVVTTRFGTARAIADTTIFPSQVPVRKGATVLVLHYVGEGAWKIWANGTIDSWEIDEPTGVPFSGSPLHMVRPPATTWWVQIRNSKGQVGWTTRADDFEGKGPS